MIARDDRIDEQNVILWLRRKHAPGIVRTGVVRADKVGETAGFAPRSPVAACQEGVAQRGIRFEGKDARSESAMLENLEQIPLAQTDDHEQGRERTAAKLVIEPARGVRDAV